MKGEKPDTGTIVPEVTEQPADVFDNAFDAAAAEKLTESKDVVTDEPKTVVDEKPVEAKKAEPVIEKDKTKEAERSEVEQPDEEKTYEQRWKSLQGIYKSSKAAWDKEKAELVAQTKREPAPTPINKEKEERPVTLSSFLESLTPEQKAELEDYEKDFDIISKMEGLKRDRALAAFNAELKAFKEEVLSQLAPAANLMKEYQVEREVRTSDAHFGSIAQAHPDYEEYRDNGSILAWIDSKPKYLQKGLKDIYQNGEAEEVVELLSDFKKENNLLPANENAQVVDLNGKREQKRQALKGVPSRRSAVNPAMSVSEDFESAFEEATNK